MGVASLVLGIVSLVVGFIPCCGMLAVIPAVIGFVLGIVDVVKKGKTGSSKGMGVAGIVLSVIAILVIIVWVLIIGAGSTVTDDGSVTTSSGETSTMEETNKNQIGEGNLDNYYVKIGNHQITKNYSGDPILLVDITFTNNNDEAKAFAYNLDCKAYQNGVELKTPISTYGINNYNWEDKTKEIKKGVTYEFKLAFEISDTSTPVELEIIPLFSFSDNQKITKTLEL